MDFADLLKVFQHVTTTVVTMTPVTKFNVDCSLQGNYIFTELGEPVHKNFSEQYCAH
jgi:hypothetical protein